MISLARIPAPEGAPVGSHPHGDREARRASSYRWRVARTSPPRIYAGALAEDAAASRIAAMLKGADLAQFERDCEREANGHNVILATALRYERARRLAFARSAIVEAVEAEPVEAAGKGEAMPPIANPGPAAEEGGQDARATRRPRSAGILPALVEGAAR